MVIPFLLIFLMISSVLSTPKKRKRDLSLSPVYNTYKTNTEITNPNIQLSYYLNGMGSMHEMET